MARSLRFDLHQLLRNGALSVRQIADQQSPIDAGIGAAGDGVVAKGRLEEDVVAWPKGLHLTSQVQQSQSSQALAHSRQLDRSIGHPDGALRVEQGIGV
ncbi:MAG: hypothetical protein EBV28_04670 [Betaproteobacteria bacterium]|nr:hypothetical protein [Betaproteobacteria bacterium]